MKIEQVNSKILQPIYNGIDDQPVPTTKSVPPIVFDKTYKPPNPSNSLLEQGLQKVLSECREWAGRLGEDDDGQFVILLNDEGMRFLEASADCTLDEAMPFTVSTLLELNSIQLTRFTCGSLVLSFSSNLIVADGVFLAVDSKSTRVTLHERNIFVPRNPCDIKFDHNSVEIAKRKINEDSTMLPYSKDDLDKASTSSLSSEDVNGGYSSCYSTFKCLVAHLWRVITTVRGLGESDTTYVRISVNGRRRLRPRVPNEYFGNLVLWAFPETQGKNLFDESLSHTAGVIHDAVAKVNNEYFKSFVDFANKNQHDENLMPKKVSDKKVPSLWPNLEINSWLGFPFNNVDFRVGKPSIFMPSFDPFEGMIYVVPSVFGDGNIDVYVTLFQQHLPLFEQIC
ncbi:hypothetical protein MKW92_003393 [Papaver armeniacum]|nr:hypothetical protein MKW92_003393 [Papaver armeniacum]